MANQNRTYAVIKQELDEYLARVEDPELDIDAAAEAYTKGMILVKELEQILAVKAKQVKISPKKLK